MNTNEQIQFSQLHLDPRIIRALSHMSPPLYYPTLVQKQCIDFSLQGRDILAQAYTGSGKTLAYLIPIVQSILLKKSGTLNEGNTGVFSIILTPSSDLSLQVFNVLTELIRYSKDFITIIFLGSSSTKMSQLKQLGLHPDIIVGTVGHIWDHVKTSNINLDSLQILVLDEADSIFDYELSDDLSRIIQHLNETGIVHQSFLMSATMSDDVKRLKEYVLQNPILIKAEMESDEPLLKQLYYKCSDKFLSIYGLMTLSYVKGKTIFFVNSLEQAFKLKLFLDAFSLSSAVLNHELPSNTRYSIIQQFNKSLLDRLITTDSSIEFDEDALSEKDEEIHKDGRLISIENNEIRLGSAKEIKSFARGIDFKDVAIVVNFDIPTSYRLYLHRIGRTARAGASGKALSLISSSDEKFFSSITSHLNDDKISELSIPDEHINAFSYRCSDVLRRITKRAIKDARKAELELELANSSKLKRNISSSREESKGLMHDKSLNLKPSTSLAIVPKYLLPNGYESQNNSTEAIKIKKKRKRKYKDPLFTFNYTYANSASDLKGSRFNFSRGKRFKKR